MPIGVLFFSDINADEFSLTEALSNGDVEDILIVFTLSGPSLPGTEASLISRNTHI